MRIRRYNVPMPRLRVITFLFLVLLCGSAAFAQNVAKAPHVTLTQLGTRPDTSAPALAETTGRLLAELRATLGIGYAGEVSLVVCSDAASFGGYLSNDGAEGHAEILGVAVPSRSSIALNMELIRRADSRPETVYKHELCHLVLAANIPPHLRPLWFEEGLAQWVSETPYEAALSAAGHAGGRGHDPASLEEISRMAAGQIGDMAEGYAHAQAAVNSLVYHFGEDGLRRLVAELSRTEGRAGHFAEAFSRCFNTHYHTWQNEFIESRQRASWTRIAGFLGEYWMGFAFLLATVALIIAAGIKRRREQKMIERWEEEDRMFPPDLSWAAARAPEKDADTAVAESLEIHGFDDDEEDADEEDDDGFPKRI